MNNNNQEKRPEFESPEIEPQKNLEKEKEFRKRAEKSLGEIFDRNENGRERIEEILLEIEPYLKSNLVNEDEIRRSLDGCFDIGVREQFIEEVMVVLKPIFDLREDNPRAFNTIRRKVEREKFNRKFTEVNEVLSYGVGDGELHIHLPPSENLIDEIGGRKALELFEDGLKDLAKIVKENEAINKITATSWIIAEHPKLVERLGFMIEGEIDDATREKHFKDEKRRVDRASITREAFLEKYLQE